MLRIINGQQRSGKSFYTVNFAVNILVKSDRPICTNLPLVVDEMCKLVAKRRGCTEQEVNERITVLEHEQVKTFWQFSQANSVIILDELYEVFSARDWKNSSEELLSYTRQHGHYQDDLYLISHELADLDATIRRGANEILMIRNTKHMSLFGDFKYAKYFFPGLKFPHTRFVAFHYEKENFKQTHLMSKAYMKESLRPDPQIFKCYNSFSHAKGIKNKELADGILESDNVENKSYIRQIFESIFNAWVYWLGLICAIIIIYSCYKGFLATIDMLSGNSKQTVDLSVDQVEQSELSQNTEQKKAMPVKDKNEVAPLPEVKQPRIMTQRVIELRDGKQFVLGLQYNGYKLAKINKNGVLVWLKDQESFLSSVEF